MELLTAAFVGLGLIGFILLLLAVAKADRRAKNDVKAGREPHFSWSWFICTICLLAGGIGAVLSEWIYEKHIGKGIVFNYIGKGLSVIFLAVAAEAFHQQIRWLLYLRREKRISKRDL